MARLDYDIGVFAANEAARIERCLTSIDRAADGRRARIALLLNGTTDQSLDIVRRLRLENAALSVYLFQAADKANAINCFLHDLRLDAATYVCVDGYAWIDAGALKALEASFHAAPRALLASGVPTNGRSATAGRATILKGGAVGGQLYAMKPEFVNNLVAKGLRLPVQLYRGDGLLGSIAAHEFDAVGHNWDSGRVIGVAEAGFAISPLSIFSWHDIKRQYARELRQARGRLENESIKSIIYTRGYQGLPRYADDMIKGWLQSHHPAPISLREWYFTRLAIRQLGRDCPAPSALEPALVLERPNVSR